MTARQTKQQRSNGNPPEASLQTLTPPTDTDPVHRIATFLLTQVNAGVPPEDILRIVTLALEAMPEVLAKKTRAAARKIKSGVAASAERYYTIEDTGDAITKWYSDRVYLLKGQPRPLRLRGPAPSMESLMREVNPAFELKDKVNYLLETHSIRKTGIWYRPCSQIQSTRGSGEHARHHLRTQSFLLANQDHNSAPREQWESWYDFAAEYSEFPESQLPAMRKFVWKQSDAFLLMLDDVFQRLARRRKVGESTRRVVWGLYEAQQPNSEQSNELRDLLRLVRREMKFGNRRAMTKAVGSTKLGKSTVGGADAGKL